MLGEGLACPPCNIGPRSTPNYAKLAQEAVHPLPGGQTVFAGQRNDPFFVDIGSIFDLADLRPIQNLHLIPTPAAPGVDTLQTLNVHSIAIQVPIKSLTVDGSVPTERDELEGGDRRLGLGEPAQAAHLRRREQRTLRGGPVGAGLAARRARCSTRC